MTNLGIDEALNRLSVKFNKIFYDRDFVASVSEDLQRVINDKNKCCVLVFPTLSPNYLRVVRYQAKLCDLAVISLSSGSAKSIGVCQKKYFLPTTIEEDCKKGNPCSTQMADNPATATKKKRPPIQLYVPPAQRKSRLSAPNANVHKDDSSPRINRAAAENRPRSTSSTSNIKKEKQGVEADCNETFGEAEICYCTEDLVCFVNKKNFPIPYFSYQCNCVKFFLFKDLFPYAKLLIFSINRIKHSFHWIRCYQGNTNVVVDDTKLENWAILNKTTTIFKNITSFSRSAFLFVPETLWDSRELNILNEDYQNEFRNVYCLCGDRILVYIPDYKCYCYLSVPDFQIYDNELTAESFLYCEKENGSLCVEEFIKKLDASIVIHQVSKTQDDSLLVNLDLPKFTQKVLPSDCDSKFNSVCAKPEIANGKDKTPEGKGISKQIDQVVVLDERIETPKVGPKNISTTKDKTKQNEHEQEKEIMRKAKQNINRKTRPIIKYVGDDNDTLKIGKGDNVNSWEELFDDEGELQEDIFSEVVQKVGPEVTIVKATEDYSAYASKHIEELEHMVELYDFPASLETHDIMSAFSGLNSDSMYIKWVDDTHALLVLGSYSQSQKAIELSNPLIKVRPMSAASSQALEKANQFDLKPAMKRPQTNLQTARRLITSHLGAKSRVSKEQSAKEREDLRIAKELKKQAKQNEKDAWEGNLRSSIN